MRNMTDQGLIAGIVLATLALGSIARAQTATSPSAIPSASQPAKPKRERRFDGDEDRPPIIWAVHIGDEHFKRLCDDLRLDDATRVAAGDLHQRYLQPMQALATEQDEERYQWNLKAEAELAPEIVIPEGKTPRDLPEEQQRQWFEQQRSKQMGISRAYGHMEFAVRKNDFIYAQSMTAMKLEATQRAAFLESLQTALPPASAARWDRAMNLLAINLASEFEKHPRAMISDPNSRLALHDVVRAAATDEDGELHGLTRLPGLEADAETAGIARAIETLDGNLIEYEISMAAVLDEDPIRVREASHVAVQAYNRGEFELSRAMEAQVRDRNRSKYNLKISTARAIGEFLKDARGEAAALQWNDRFDAAHFPALHFRDSVDEMHDWLLAGDIALDDAQREAIEQVYADYLDARRRQRERIMPLLIDRSCDPNALVSMANGDQHSARAIAAKALEERKPPAEKAHANMRAVLDGEGQAKFDAKRVEVGNRMLGSLAQPSPP